MYLINFHQKILSWYATSWKLYKKGSDKFISTRRVYDGNTHKIFNIIKKIAYGSGDAGSNFFYTLVSTFILLYLTDVAGLNAGIVGTLMMVAKILDGITDIFFGHLLDKTHNKMGKARPWMFFSAFPLAICTILMFSIPSGIGTTAQYAYFFVLYTSANALFYTIFQFHVSPFESSIPLFSYLYLPPINFLLLYHYAPVTLSQPYVLV